MNQNNNPEGTTKDDSGAYIPPQEEIKRLKKRFFEQHLIRKKKSNYTGDNIPGIRVCKVSIRERSHIND